MTDKYIYIPDIPAQMIEQPKDKINPIGNQILFKPLVGNNITDTGLFIPSTAMEISNKGILVKVGKGTVKRPMKLKEGQIAYRVKNWGEQVVIENEIYFLMDESAILATE